ncbi:polyprenyl synthetase family protein [Amycolatopsis acidiphila]|uniref:Polyprenyl synthetase family protein n=1 Tax=Amycolatopsis acidiphila TaxID=715473 RepID=A0A558ACN5_9PSEU|nr:polyprenyl synthetase family protein [Amycolatopsis acidiphila]TVT22032.1 polyprenyl synthetase family protein [Amycolatopsis acidiphila]UIJ63650.1 polyprenyl synthetase family protein [Amycolatopsis acidiphila]GHG67684.1 geranylgeranyl pyrophosphate synthase [Amycolatopsis acidiphila]
MPARLTEVSVPPRPRPPAEADFGWLRRAVDAELEEFLDGQARHPLDACLPPLVDVLREFVGGGKRVHPLFCYCGWLAAGGEPGGSPLGKVGAALELFHTFALIHDDVMDASDRRRGRPTVHRVLAGRYHGKDPAAAARFGVDAAILLGDLCHAWSDELLCAAGERWRRRVEPVLHVMRTQVMAGQYLDLAGEWAEDSLDRSWRTLRHKTAGYTVERPLQIGVMLAEGGPEALRLCTTYGRPLGEAFQLRDDLLGVFGRPGVTGKSTLDDLREGKRTVLMALTWRRASPRQRAIIRELHGDPALDDAGAERLRSVITRTGADRAVAELIEVKTEKALAALDGATIPGGARVACAELAHAATRRAR